MIWIIIIQFLINVSFVTMWIYKIHEKNWLAAYNAGRTDEFFGKFREMNGRYLPAYQLGRKHQRDVENAKKD